MALKRSFMAFFRTSVFLLLATILFGLVSLHGQNDRYRAVNWTIDAGLSQNSAFQMLKDAQGFLWITTENGLNRFDGKKFKQFYHIPNQEGSILGSYIIGIEEDSLHNIWVGTDRGISRFDLQKETFQNFLPKDTSSSESFVIPFWATKNEVYAIDGLQQIVSFDVLTLKKRYHVKLMPSDSVLQGTAVVSAYLDEKTKSVWIGRPHAQSLIQISLITGKRNKYGWTCYKKIKGHNHALENLCYDQMRNCFWFNTSDGLLKFTLSDKKFHRISAPDNLPDLPRVDDSFKDLYWVGIDQDVKGRIWVPSPTKGMFIYDPDANQAISCFPENQDWQAAVSDFNAYVYCDRSGMVWCGFWQAKGVYQILPFHQVAKRFADQVNVINVIKGPPGQLWMGTFDGVLIFEPKTKAIRFLKKKDLPGIQQEIIVPVNVNMQEQKAWLHSDVLYEMDLNSKQCRPLIFKNQQGQEINPERIYYTNAFQGACMTMAAYKDKISVFVAKASSLYVQEVLSFPAHTIDAFLTRPIHDKWLFLKRSFALKNLSYVNKNGKWVQIKTTLDDLEWTYIYYNPKDESFWVAAEKRLIHLDKTFRILKTYTPENGLPGLDLTGIITDEEGALWFRTDRSIHRLDNQTGIITSLSGKDGFSKKIFALYGGVLKNEEELLYFPSGYFVGTGFEEINPQQFQSTPSTVYIHSIHLNNAPFLSHLGYNNISDLSLCHHQNNLSFEVGVIDFYAQGKNSIRYKLEGLNDRWNYIPNYTTLRYENLAPGHYTLVLQASNSSNKFSGPEKRIKIYISPPWWQTWWAYSCFTIFAASLLWGYTLYRSRQLLLENQQLEIKVNQRTLELNQSLESLKSTQAQLIQSEKLASLGELTAGIAHEIQNPLNFVNNFAEVSAEILDEMQEELEKGDTTEAIAIASDLRTNLERINHHGQRASSIVKGMLEHSRASTGVKELTDLNALADEYLRLAYHGLRAKDNSFNATLETHFAPDLPKVSVIPQEIGRVLLNLINNAFYAVDEHSRSTVQKRASIGVTQSHADTTQTYQPTVTISTQKTDDQIIIKVQDNGNGIPEAIKDKIFQPFFTTKPTGQGTGLGLSLAYDIVTKGHGGVLEVQSQDGDGATFIISLPFNHL